ncbi:MAG: methyltransferase domain-containing protein [Chloroflexi bacterium]|nr:methyltransferase domain-containing protein [Chloroflexota bacterium]
MFVVIKVINWVLKFLYDLLYHQFAWFYDVVAAVVSLRRWNTWVHQALPFINRERILEIGFGPGHLLYSALLQQKNIIGIDESKQMVRRAYNSISTIVKYPPLVRGNILALPFPNQYFDQVVSTFPSEFIFNKTAVAEIYRVLSPGGQVIILPFAWITGKLWYERILSLLIDIDILIRSWPEKFCSGIIQQGFELSIQKIIDDKSVMIFVIATKPEKVYNNRLETLIC